MSDADDPRTVFLKSLPRKIVEIKATLGAFLADPRSTRMRDELRRRLGLLLSLTRSHELQHLSDALAAAEDILDPTRSDAPLENPDIRRLTTHIASLSTLAAAEKPQPGTRISSQHTLRGFSRPPETPHLVPVTPLRSSLPPPPSPGAVRTPGPAGHTPAPLAPSHPVPSFPYSPPPSPFAASQSVLFVGGSLLCATLRSVLPTDIDLMPTDNLSDALALARDTAPDVVVAEADPPSDGPSQNSKLSLARVDIIYVMRRDPGASTRGLTTTPHWSAYPQMRPEVRGSSDLRPEIIARLVC